MSKLTLAYFGASDFSAVFLERLLADKSNLVEVKFVVTQPDRPVGRRGILTPTPVKIIAQRFNINTIDSDTDLINKLKGIDLALLYAYGKIIKLDYLNSPKYGFWNIHPSLLPRYRGASPIAYPIMMGDRESGVSIIQMDGELDHGALLAQKSERVSPTELKKNLEERLTNISYELFREKIKNIGVNLELKNQNHELATYTRKLSKNDGYVSQEFIKSALYDSPIIPANLPIALNEYISKFSATLPQLKKSAGETFYNYYRAMHPWPGIWTKINIKNIEKRLKITDTSYNPDSSTLKILRVQLEGKNEVDFQTFTTAYGNVF